MKKSKKITDFDDQIQIYNSVSLLYQSISSLCKGSNELFRFTETERGTIDKIAKKLESLTKK